jgi:ankyrin repeat protein
MIRRTILAMLFCAWVPGSAGELTGGSLEQVRSLMDWGRPEAELIDEVERLPRQALATIDRPLGSRGETLAMLVAARGHVDLLRVLAAQGADLSRSDHSGDSVLAHAIRSPDRRTELVAFLLAHLPTLPPANRAGWTPLGIAQARGDEVVARALQAAGAAPTAFDAHAYRDLLAALRAGRLEHAQAAVDRGAPLRQLDEEGRSLLTHAIIAGRLESVAWLLDRGASPHALDPDGISPLALVAGIADRLPILELLLERGGDPNQANSAGETPLMAAVRGQQVEAVRLLLARGANVHAEAADGSTALHLAIAPERLPVIRALLAAGADPRRPNRMGDSAIAVARRAGLMEVLAVLERP